MRKYEIVRRAKSQTVPDHTEFFVVEQWGKREVRIVAIPNERVEDFEIDNASPHRFEL